MTITRRSFLKCSAGAGAGLILPWTVGQALAARGPRSMLTKYIQPLPVPGNGIVVATPSGTNRYAFTQTPIARQVHPHLPPTPIWAYDDGSGLSGQAGSFGVVIVVETGTPLDVTYTHDLPETYPDWIPVDTRLTPLGDQVRVMTHLHGAFVAGDSDGNPALTPNGFGLGETQTVYYPNEQPATLLWFHDHALGATRLNVFAGLAGAYIIRDEFDTGQEPNPIGIPGGAYEIPLVFKDYQFNPDGTFLYPTSDIENVIWIGEYFGDVMLVNGKVWPFLDVEPRMYRFRILNACNSRILNLEIAGVTFWQIGADGGMWDVPVPTRNVVLAPAERADVIADFSRFAGCRLVMMNHRPRRPISTPAPQLPQAMQFRVGRTVNQPGPGSIPSSLPGRAANLGNAVTTRFITLNEVAPETPGWFLNLSAQHFEDQVTEAPQIGTIEDWVFINMTEDTHPMHVHLVQFQVVGRTPFDEEAYEAAYGGPNGVPGGIDPTPFATGPMQPPDPTERGFKDTVRANPGFFTTIRAKFDLPTGVTLPQTYVYHCHIVEHEDNDMMRPYTVLG